MFPFNIRLYDGAGDGAGAGDGGSAGAPQLPEGAFMANDFVAALPEDLRSDPNIVKYSKGGLEAFARGHLSVAKMYGKDPARVVDLPDDLQDMGKVRPVLHRLGLPADEAGYKIQAPENTPSYLGIDQGVGKAFLKRAYEAGVLPAQAQAIYAGFVEDMTSAEKDIAADGEARSLENKRALEAKWGTGDPYNQRVALANTAIDKVGGQVDLKDGGKGNSLQMKLNAAGLGNDPEIMQVLHLAGERLQEDRGDGGGRPRPGPGSASSVTQEEAKARADELQNKALREKDPAERRRLSAEAQRYYAVAAPGTIKAYDG